MSEDQDKDQKTEEPTPKRLTESREKGQVPRSREMATAAVVAASAATLLGMGKLMSGAMADWMKDGLTLDVSLLNDPSKMPEQMVWMMGSALLFITPLLVACLFAAIAATLLLGGGNFSMKALVPNFSKLNPIKGLGRMFSFKSLAELGKGLLKVVLVGGCAVFVLGEYQGQLLGLSNEPNVSASFHSANILLSVLAALTVPLIIIAMIDVPIQLWTWKRDLKMTREEVRREMKESEGDPQVKARVRRMQQEMSKARMMEDVPHADVVVTNPTHYAIALKYDSGKMRAPRVLAKGADLVAQTIREVAIANKVMIVSSPPLARALFKSVNVGQEIPADLYAVVAKLLTYIYQLRSWNERGGRAPNLPKLEVPIELSDPPVSPDPNTPQS